MKTKRIIEYNLLIIFSIVTSITLVLLVSVITRKPINQDLIFVIATILAVGNALFWAVESKNE